MRSLYDEIQPRNYGHIQVDDTHELYYEESGNPSGIPVIFLHGGPGAGSKPNHRRYFNPRLYRIINFDQRGCNRSRPQGETRNNTTWDLLSDIELLRRRLAIEKWLLFAGSWGATLALLYAEEYPDQVCGMILRGTFLARQKDLDWFVRGGVTRIFPDAAEKFREIIPPDSQHDPVSAYYGFMQSKDPETVREAAMRWAAWSGQIVTYSLAEADEIAAGEPDKTINEVRIETHYAKHHYFIEENRILNNIDQIPEIPVIIIHGRRDLTCTLEASWILHKALPSSRLNIVRTGGHLSGEPVMTDALIRATDDMPELLT